MLLKQYLSDRDLTYAAFASAIGVSTKTAWRYANGQRIPRPKIMALIVEATGGAVTAQDFFDQATKGEAA